MWRGGLETRLHHTWNGVSPVRSQCACMELAETGADGVFVRRARVLVGGLWARYEDGLSKKHEV